MSGLEIKPLDTPDEVRPFAEDKGAAHVVKFSSGPVGRGVFEPGWRWSEHVKPIAGTHSCQTTHLGYVLSGRMGIRMDDGTEGEVGPGDVFFAQPGHDAWTVGNEACVAVDFGASASQYATRK